LRILTLHSAELIQVVIKYDKQVLVLDGVSRNAQCSELLAMLEVRLGVKIPWNAKLTKNGRSSQVLKSIDEVRKSFGRAHHVLIQHFIAFNLSLAPNYMHYWL
jgi:hypothetical protein